jgi:hypothetical protein
MSDAYSTNGKNEIMHINFVGKRDGKRLLKRSVCRSEDNIKIKLKGVGFEDVD